MEEYKFVPFCAHTLLLSQRFGTSAMTLFPLAAYLAVGKDPVEETHVKYSVGGESSLADDQTGSLSVSHVSRRHRVTPCLVSGVWCHVSRHFPRDNCLLSLHAATTGRSVWRAETKQTNKQTLRETKQTL